MIRRRPRSFAALCLLAAVGYAAGAGCLSGCVSPTPATCAAPHAGSSPLQQVVAAREAYVGILAALNAAHRLGYLPDADKRRIEPFRSAASDWLDKMEAAALSGDAGAAGGPFAAAVAEYNKAMAEVSKAKLKADQTQSAVERVQAARATTAPAPKR